MMVVFCWVKGCTNKLGTESSKEVFFISWNWESTKAEKLCNSASRADECNRKDEPSEMARIYSEYFVSCKGMFKSNKSVILLNFFWYGCKQHYSLGWGCVFSCRFWREWNAFNFRCCVWTQTGKQTLFTYPPVIRTLLVSKSIHPSLKWTARSESESQTSFAFSRTPNNCKFFPSLYLFNDTLPTGFPAFH